MRHFLPTPVPRDAIADILRVAQWAPSPHNVQPWRFTGLFDDGEKLRLAEAMGERLKVDLQADGLSLESIERQVDRSLWRVTSAPVVLVVSLVSTGLVEYVDERRAALEWQMAVQSLGAVLQTIFLTAWRRGIGSCWLAAPMYCPAAVRDVLSLPGDFEPQALALLGYASASGKVRERRPFTEVVDLR